MTFVYRRFKGIIYNKSLLFKIDIMKKSSILIAALFLLCSAQAQKTHLGVKGGVNVSNLHFNDNVTTHSKVGVNFGMLAHIHASKTWAIQPELVYSLEGGKPGDNSDVTYNLNFLNVPVLLQYMFENGFRLESGPQIGFLLSAKTKTNDVTVTNHGFESTAISLPLGAGYLTSSGWGIDARYVFGLSNLNSDRNGSTIQSNVFQLGLFYQFSDTKFHHH